MFSLFLREKVCLKLLPLLYAHLMVSLAVYRRSMLGISVWRDHWSLWRGHFQSEGMGWVFARNGRHHYARIYSGRLGHRRICYRSGVAKGVHGTALEKSGIPPNPCDDMGKSHVPWT